MVFLVSCWLSRSSLVHPGAEKAYHLLLRVKLNSQRKPVWRRNTWTAFGCFQRLPLEMPAVGTDLAGKWGTLPWGVEHSLCKIPFYLAGLESYPALCITGLPRRRRGRRCPQFPLFCTWTIFTSMNKKEMLTCITVKWSKKCVCSMYCGLSVSVLLWKWRQVNIMRPMCRCSRAM